MTVLHNINGLPAIYIFFKSLKRKEKTKQSPTTTGGFLRWPYIFEFTAVEAQAALVALY